MEELNPNGAQPRAADLHKAVSHEKPDLDHIKSLLEGGAGKLGCCTMMYQ